MERNENATVEFVEKISELVKAENEPFHVENVLGKTFVNKRWYEVEKNKPEIMKLHSLKSLVDFVKTTVENNNCNLTLPLVIEASYTTMLVHTSLADDSSRVTIATVEPIKPDINFGRFIDIHNFIIQLQTCFADTENKKMLLDTIKYISTEAKVETVDNGISNTVTATTGVSLKKEISIPPIVKLVGYRTYREIEQPETMYLLRAEDGGKLALFEADGGEWQCVAQKRVSEYLYSELSEQIDSGKVVIMG
ncbi:MULTISPECIES: hypothetical protein [Bacillota]|jgi:hypothetical protein|uniref:Phage protein n=2 Tax=Erysipelotrichaceae TaxID=128827 RepID=A0A7G9GLS3_9FIRM|nr:MULTISPECIES: hypothetical protein [Bacillota]QNM11755.1 hypothetical protein H9Q80_16130 [[Eubacterium] hominis]RGB56027.1 hypothetical protein DW271_07395 [Absiella sp. AM22-9]RGB61788.1 hypothetical protein DW120_05440 [Absiella sp. AM10-20]RGB70391.1 hypothetical protein DW113_01275 [Absiella sp. AM09-45]RGB78677.1 hypothetical protein DW114_02540 [Absiella sp. AM09-50]